MKSKPTKATEGPQVDEWAHWVESNAGYVKLGVSKFELAALSAIAKEMPTRKGPRVGFAAWAVLRLALVFHDEMQRLASAAFKRCEAEGIRQDDFMGRRIAEQFGLSLNQIDGRCAGLFPRPLPKCPALMVDLEAGLDAELRNTVAGLDSRARNKLALRYKRWAKQIQATQPALERAERAGEIQGKAACELKPGLN